MSAVLEKTAVDWGVDKFQTPGENELVIHNLCSGPCFVVDATRDSKLSARCRKAVSR